MQSKASDRPRKHPDLIFWGCFLLLNLLLFLPFYLINIDENTSIHLLATLHDKPLTGLFNIFIWRDDADPFRINTELVLMLALWVNVGWLRRGPVRWLMTFIYFFGLLYYIYESIMVYLYRSEPVFYSQFYLIRDGLQFLLDHLTVSPVAYFGLLAAVIAVMAVIVFVFRTAVDRELSAELSPTSRRATLGVAGAVVLSAATYRGVSADPRMVVSSLGFKLKQNIADSLALYNSIVKFDDTDIYRTYNYAKYHLAKKPNVYLLFVESYGRVLYERPDWRDVYIKKLHSEEKKLTDGGFHFASNFSVSPTWGGGSWLAYTSAIYGLHIGSQPQYLTLKDRYGTKTPHYPDLGTYMRSQGYHYFWTTALSDELGDKAWTAYKGFYNVDDWLRFSDLGYKGPLFGWGPAPADQYTLAYARDVAMAEHQPLFMFYLTQNSHFPFQPLPSMVDDWQELGKPKKSPAAVDVDSISHDELRAAYFAAIMYDLDMLTDFVLNHAEEEAVFVLVGDHEPPAVSRRADGYETPMHVISRDPAFIANLQQYGFHDSTLVIPDEFTPIYHESIYSLLVRTLNQTYGVDPEQAPDYLARGVDVPDWITNPNGDSTS